MVDGWHIERLSTAALRPCSPDAGGGKKDTDGPRRIDTCSQGCENFKNQTSVKG